jgi:hypothetical protein
MTHTRQKPLRPNAKAPTGKQSPPSNTVTEDQPDRNDGFLSYETLGIAVSKIVATARGEVGNEQYYEYRDGAKGYHLLASTEKALDNSMYAIDDNVPDSSLSCVRACDLYIIAFALSEAVIRKESDRRQTKWARESAAGRGETGMDDEIPF